ncbi:hypothetical protein [Flavilitoribacter nigricans]|uniref:Sulfotransferase family protein n=1 Tax=Flavilitoribacter nigricans (strain ATCC 23147 / DSM 23189 / NBRC 102662 / NCIMB 1420 / SS-2) TaxID=1122177 RepID=A0A2D0NJG6_FLAN2|nr:hypothetical protein [Flavilitoribacter nigricans]PHN08597.1 hypothetical protein CRP01_01410 [Flavilitoribacter nigricans DSM 23189 = NBRC 102662]
MTALHVRLGRIKKALLLDYYQLLDKVLDTDKHIRYRHRMNGFDNPDYTFARDQISFIHIPKTGGTTLANMLEKDPGDTFVNLHIHRPVSMHCPPGAYRYLTIMREPVSRVWSHYQMVLREYPGFPYQKYANRGLETFLKKNWAVRNLYCRYFSGSIDPEPDESTLAIARKNLADFTYVIPFEDFSNSVQLFLRDHHIPYEEVLHDRKSKYPEPSPDEMELIARYNRFDLALYEAWRTENNYRK